MEMTEKNKKSKASKSQTTSAKAMRDEKAMDTVFMEIVGRIYDETSAIRGCRSIKPQTYSIQIGMDEL